MALRDDLLAFAPEITDNSRVDLMLNYAALRINRRVFGPKADLGTILLACHMLIRFDPAADPEAAGQTIRVKIGQMEAQSATLVIPGDEELCTTRYGANFAQMRKALGISPLVV